MKCKSIKKNLYLLLYLRNANQNFKTKLFPLIRIFSTKSRKLSLGIHKIL